MLLVKWGLRKGLLLVKADMVNIKARSCLFTLPAATFSFIWSHVCVHLVNMNPMFPLVH